MKGSRHSRRTTRSFWRWMRSQTFKRSNECVPRNPCAAGQIERQEFEYERHGIVNFLVLLNIYNGHMRSCCLDKNDSEHLCRALPACYNRFTPFDVFTLIWDGGPSHISAATLSFLRSIMVHGCVSCLHQLMLPGSIKPKSC